MKINYIKLRADFKYTTKGRFYRTFLVKENISLVELGELIVNIFGGTMEHIFMFHTKNNYYIPPSFIKGWDDFGYFNHESFNNKTIKDLPQRFIFAYDTGDGWDFDCKIYKTIVTKEIADDAHIPTGFVLDAKGMGIWEDNIGTLYAYLDGEIDGDFDGEDDEKGIYKPWNFNIKKYKEFDDPVDIDELNKRAMNFYTISDENDY